jgi:hypothetical protein
MIIIMEREDFLSHDIIMSHEKNITKIDQKSMCT